VITSSAGTDVAAVEPDDEVDGMVEAVRELDQATQPVPQLGHVRLAVGQRSDLVEACVEEWQDRVRLALDARRRHASEPLPMVAHRDPGGRGGASPTASSWLGCALDEAPSLAVGDGGAGRAM